MSGDYRPNVGRPPEISVREVSAMLADRIESVCRALGLSGAVIQGAMTPLNPTRNDRNPGSFVIHLSGPKQGRWDEYATGDYGDTLDLVAYINFGRMDRTSKREAMIWAKRFLGIGDASHMDPAHSAKLRAARETMEQNTARAEALALANQAKDRRRAQAMFLEAKPLAPGLPGWTYLTEARGIDLTRLERLPWAVRSHHAMRHVETDQVVPCLISALLFPDGSFGGVHRIFLEPGGRSKLTADPGVAVKKGLTDACAFAEGVEDAFTVALLTPEWRVSAVGASANFVHVDPPQSASAVIAIRDRDISRKVMDGVTRKVDGLRAKAEARDLPFFESWPGRGFKDFNDMLRGVRQ